MPLDLALSPDALLDALVADLGGSDMVRAILDIVGKTTGMGFVAVAHVTESRWVAVEVRDAMAFGLGAGGELPVKNTLCDTVRGTRNAIIIDEVASDPLYRHHPVPAIYGLQSYIAVPIVLEDGELFGTLCAIDPAPHKLDTPEIRGMFELFARLIATQLDRLRARVRNRSLESQVAEALAQKKVYADIVENSTSAVTALDLDGRILAINRANVEAFARVFGKRPQVGDDFLSLFERAPELAAQQRAIWSRALGGESFVIVEEFGDPQLERRCYEVRFSPLLDSRGERIGASSTSYDVTDRVAAEAQLAAAQEQLHHAQKLEAIGQLTGGVAHDFNNLLTPIVGALDILQRRAEIGERDKRLIAAASLSAERARTLVQRLLAFARRQPLQPGPVDVGGLASGMVDLIGSTIGPNIQISLTIDEGLPPALADRNQLEMALLNLSVNARDAMPQGGELRISASRRSVAAKSALGLAEGDYVRLDVADSGAGMDEATRKRAIEPFFSTKPPGQGTGLGLSMVDGLARQLGGAVAIESAPGRGTQVSLWLPASHASAPAPIAVAKFDGARRTGVVLLVDDEALVRLSTARMLSELGYAVEEAASAEEALMRLDAGLRPDIVVTDHLMPGMTGADFVGALTLAHPGIPALIVTGYAEAGVIASGLPRLTKPFQLDDLAARLASLTP